MRPLTFFFAFVLAAMVAVTVTASLDRGVLAAAADLWPDPWFRATLADAYFAFLTVWAWIAWREPTWPRRLLWLVLVLTLGNFAIAAYGLAAIARLRPGDGPKELLLGRHAGPSGRPGVVRREEGA